MSEEEYIEICILSQPKEIATKNIIQLLEQKDKRIDDLEKALVEEAIKSTEKIKELNKGINTLMIKRKKWKNRYYKSKNIIYELLKKVGVK